MDHSLRTKTAYSVLTAVTASLLLLHSCAKEDEDFPIEPRITSIQVAFDDVDSPNNDTLSVTISFTDGDGDIGLVGGNSPDTLYPRQPCFFFLKATGELVPSDDLFTGKVSIDELIRLSDRENPPWDTLPERTNGCNHYNYYNIPVDPPYTILNENFYNILIDYLYEDANGEFLEFDWSGYCITYDGRFPNLSGKSGPFTLRMDSRTKGQLTYRMSNLGFIPLFGDKRVKLRVHIKDRALHDSNTIETDPFFLNDI